MAKKRRNGQLELAKTGGWGGKRRGAGRKRKAKRPRVPHRTRPRHKESWPVHVTLRAVDEIDVLRSERVFPAVEGAIAGAQRDSFRIVLFSAQKNHVHLVVEGDDRELLIRGLHGLTGRMEKAINRALGRRGKVWSDRYHARAMTMPLDVRNTISYDFQSFRKHTRAPAGFDPCSSAACSRAGANRRRNRIGHRPAWRRRAGSCGWAHPRRSRPAPLRLMRLTSGSGIPAHSRS